MTACYDCHIREIGDVLMHSYRVYDNVSLILMKTFEEIKTAVQTEYGVLKRINLQKRKYTIELDKEMLFLFLCVSLVHQLYFTYWKRIFEVGMCVMQKEI